MSDEIYQVELPVGEKKLTIKTGHIARQAGGAVLVQLGDTVVLATTCMADAPREDQDFFPLTVDYREKTYAAGKIPGGFFKREGRPTEKEILTSRLIDRPIRPLFPDGFFNEVQVLLSVLSADQENDSDILGIIGAAASLAISEIPFPTTIAGVRVGRIGGKLTILPTISELETNDINIIVAGSADAINMVEGGSIETSEDDMLEALDFAHDWIKKLVVVIDELKAKCGKPKFEFTPPEIDEELVKSVTDLATDGVKAANQIIDKHERQEKLNTLTEEIQLKLEEQFPEKGRLISSLIHDIEKVDVRRKTLEEGKRLDGRGYEDIRQIDCQVGVLPRVHGTAIFTRGQTQALVATTLGTKMDEQKIDGLLGESFKSFMLHYNFPPFSVGETRFLRGPGRREIGHGALAERALEKVIPADGNFPYTIRIVSDILESNGSSSMASVCGSSLSLMDAGVPIKSPVAGIAMGLIKEGDKHAVLTDILGAEDHLGDMDFKVAGTKDGITAFQMDVKVTGISREVMKQALEQAHQARLHILGKMNEALDKPREELSPFAPRIIFMKIKVSKIGEVIGPGGKMIRSIIEETGAKIDIEDDGTVLISSVDQAAGEEAKARVEKLVEEAVIGTNYTGKVRRTTNFGAFIEILPGTDGMVHISELENHRVNQVEDVVRVGDMVKVKVIDIDREGKIRLSRKAVLNEDDKK
ncbi:MAG: polyribonucleotide nucleotidyltransferase [candidate division Zixibacteria bacterium]|nr:polyribonucleotide nucleotidyltransferase [candidate division Zixibacteria bacterium]